MTASSLLNCTSNVGLAPCRSDWTGLAICQEVLDENPAQVEQYKAKPTLMGWFVGQVMRKMRGKADPQLAQKTLEELLSQ